ncbi:unnamed protein product, partial [Lampetra planeri]
RSPSRVVSSEAGDAHRWEKQRGGRSKAEGELLFPATETTFVFGQNMNERVVSPVRGDEAERGAEGSERDGGEGGEEGGGDVNNNNNSSSSSHHVNNNNLDDVIVAVVTRESLARRVSPSPCLRTLEESAAAYTEATSKRCLLETVETRTGEEAESNVLQ